MAVVPHPPYSPDSWDFCVSSIEDKLNGRHFDTIEVIEAKSQAVLSTLTEHDFQDTFKKNGRSAGNGAYTWKGTTSRVKVVSRPKVSS
jgi:hypothetical protein